MTLISYRTINTIAINRWSWGTNLSTRKWWSPSIRAWSGYISIYWGREIIKRYSSSNTRLSV